MKIKFKLFITLLQILIIKITIINCIEYKYYALRTDERECIEIVSSNCGGYFIKELNTGKDETEIYISGIGQQDDIGIISENKIRNAPPYHIIFRGILKPNQDNNESFEAEAFSLYRLLPIPNQEFILTNETQFYTMGHPHNLNVPNLPSNERTKFNSLSNGYNKHVVNVQTNWLEYLVNTGNSVFTIKSKTQINDQKDNNSNNNSISSFQKPHYKYEIEYIFISLINSNNCPKRIQDIRCVQGLAATYVRNFNHCYIFFECAPKEPEQCKDIIKPQCPPGYNITSIPSYPYGCQTHYCDPSFLFLKN